MNENELIYKKMSVRFSSKTLNTTSIDTINYKII